jgi:putative transposase
MEVHIAKGLKTDEAARKEGIMEQTYHRWRREYGGLKVDQAKRLKGLEKENVRLKKLLAEAHLDKAMLQEVALGNF